MYTENQTPEEARRVALQLAINWHEAQMQWQTVSVDDVVHTACAFEAYLREGVGQ